MSIIVYYPGGYEPNAPAQNMAEQWDDATQIYTAWDQSGNITSTRPYNTGEVADCQAEQQAQAVTSAIQAARDGIEALLAAAPDYLAQIQADAQVWQQTQPGDPLTQEHIDTLVRVVNGFTTVLAAVSNQIAVTGAIPPTSNPVLSADQNQAS
jgi:hypothetical protein